MKTRPAERQPTTELRGGRSAAKLGLFLHAEERCVVPYDASRRLHRLRPRAVGLPRRRDPTPPE
jgi:hypothetical protein